MSMSAEEEEMLEQMGISGQPMGRKNLEPMAAPLKSDLKHIYCGVCRKMVDQAYAHATDILDKRFSHSKKRKREVVDFDGEGALQTYTETMCNPLKKEGEWVSKIDLVQEGDALLLASQPAAGKCRRECRTVEAACNEVLDRADTDFTEILYKGVQDNSELEKVQRYICNRAASVCKKKSPPVKARKDEAFVVMTADEKSFQDMQANLKESGMSGTMYKREDLSGMMGKMEAMLGKYGGEADVDDEEGGEEGDEVEEEGAAAAKAEL